MVVESPPALAGVPMLAAQEREEATLGHDLVPARRWSPAAVAIWFVFALGITLFIVFARVPIAAGWRQGRSMPVLDIWSLFTLELAQVAGPLVTPALVTGLVLVVLAGSLLCLWLAMTVTSDETSERPD